MYKILKKTLIGSIPILFGIVLFFIIIVIKDYHFQRKQNAMIQNFSIIDVESGNHLKLKDIEGKIKVLTFFSMFNEDCMRNRIDLLNGLHKTNHDDLKVITVFLGDYKMTDVINFKKICYLKFRCFLPTNASNERIKKLGVKKSLYSIVVNELNKIIYYDKGMNDSKYVKDLKNVLTENGFTF